MFSMKIQMKLSVLRKLQTSWAFLLTTRASASDQPVVFHYSSVEPWCPQSYALATASVVELRMNWFFQFIFLWLVHCSGGWPTK